MDYVGLYERLMNRARNRQIINGYFERHHAVPRSSGGDNSTYNVVKLTAREHFIAHWLLFRITRSPANAKAFRLMVNDGNRRRGRDYEIARNIMATSMLGNFNVAKREEVKQKIRNGLLLNHAFRGKKRPEHAVKMRGKMAGSKNPAYGMGDRQRGSKNASAKAIRGVHPIYGEKIWSTGVAAAEELNVTPAAVSQAVRKPCFTRGWRVEYVNAENH